MLLAYSSRNRSASCRIPLGSGPKAKRVEVRFPDPAANPYLAFAAMLMAGLDGIENKLNPGDPIDKNLYDLPPEELEKVPTVCGSLREACEELDKDRAFLKKGNVFTDDAIDAYLELKMEEVERFEMMPHPIEFDMYYSVRRVVLGGTKEWGGRSMWPPHFPPGSWPNPSLRVTPLGRGMRYAEGPCQAPPKLRPSHQIIRPVNHRLQAGV